MRALSIGLVASLSLAAFAPDAALAQKAGAGPSYAFAIHDDVKYPADFKNFDYVNPNAPKGGNITLVVGRATTFDSFNPFILRGVPAAGVGATFQGLMTRSLDEPATDYCVICETIDVAPDRASVEFVLRREARFQDGSPITPDDVVWTFDTLKTKGAPQYRSYYADVIKAEKTGDRKVKFTFKDGHNRELPGIIGEMVVLSKKYWSTRDFDKTTLEPPLGSGPYKIDAFEPGRYVTLRRVPDYWAANLPTEKGMNNFDTVRFDYYRDETVALEAFIAGKYDIRAENSAKNWATAYKGVPAVESGLIKRDAIKTEKERVMQGYFMNTRRPLFKDRRVREVLIYPFDFEWTNQHLFYGFYRRVRSYFGEDRDLSAHGVPQGDELAVLEKFRDKLPPEVFTTEYNPPKTDGSGNWRDGQRAALRLLREAGWRIDKEKLVDASGKQMEFEILLDNPALERITLPYVENLKRLGINARVRTVDTAQYQRRLDDFDFDMVNELVAQSESPGNEQREYWGSRAAATPGTQNFAGVSDPAVDALVDLVINAPDRKNLEARTRALDRVLQWGFYVVPQYRLYADWVAYWDRFSRPPDNPRIGYYPFIWWVDPQKDAALRAKRGG